METQTNKQVAKKQQASVDIFAANPDSAVGFDASDILIPKILLMQGSSKLVAEGKASLGDMVNSVTEEKLGDKKKGITFAPIMTYKTMTVMRDEGGRFVFDHAEPWTAKHVAVPFETTTNGTKYKNYPTLNFYVMLEEDLKKESSMPVLISFKSTSLKAGKKIINHFAQAADIGRRPCSGMLSLQCTMEKSDKGPYHAFNVNFEKETPASYGPTIMRWETILKTQQVKVDTSGDAGESEIAVETKLNKNSQF